MTEKTIAMMLAPVAALCVWAYPAIDQPPRYADATNQSSTR